MRFSTFEMFGFAVSILAMAGALWLLRVESTFVALEEPVQDAQSAVVVDATSNQTAALTDAILDASNGTDVIQQLIIDDVVIGVGDEVAEGDVVSVHYIGTLPNGQEFDSSYRRGEPFQFTVGEGRVIAGWEQGILGMQQGGQRILVIPSDLGYGDQNFGPIPAGATLVFAIELLEIQ
ncbi:MAG: FKBP-type peptidyl-prolyl cis-trans isomerase [Patescibacteria group bacterium]